MQSSQRLATVGCFDGFGPSAVHVGIDRCGAIDLSGDRRTARRSVRDQCPAEAGVYGLIDASDRLIYVGYSSCLQHGSAGVFHR